MNKILTIFVSVAAFLSASFLLPTFSSQKAFAVEPPTVEQRQKVEQRRQKRHGKIIYRENSGKGGCQYGKSPDGTCYQPKEGQLYKDPKTGEMKMKKIENVNLPWNK